MMMVSIQTTIVGRIAKPVVKWAGGKRQILPYLMKLMPSDFETYCEPFVGGAAVLISLYNSGRLKKAVVSDTNRDLINLYRFIKYKPDELLQELTTLKFGNSRKDYYCARDRYNLLKENSAEKAALFIYLNRHGYNGLYRVNSKGKFNVPFGRYSNPSLPSADEIYALSDVFKITEILNEDFETAVRSAKSGDFVYFDPPYMPVSSSAYFTDYTSAGFDKQDQIRLSRLFVSLSQRGVYVMESNSSINTIAELYSGFNITTIKAKRNINSIPASRNSVEEFIIRNYGVD